MFVGRQQQIGRLQTMLASARQHDDRKPGRAVLIRGRRRVGKSRMVEEFLSEAAVPHLYFAASGRRPEEELKLFAQDAAASDLPGAALFQGVVPESWDAALRLLSQALPEDGSVVVLDELPYLTAGDPGFEGSLQRAFDRELSQKRVLLIGVGSDISMMEALNQYGRPFHQRATEMVVPPLNPHEVAALLGLGAADAFDAYLVTGGLPLICTEWEHGMSLWDYLRAATSDPTSALLVSAERSLAAEFPGEALARTVLQAIGSGERTFGNIAQAAGGLHATSLSRALELLTEKRMVTVELPLSTRPSRETRYRVADPYMGFWLTFLGDGIAEIERGRGDRVLQRIRASWASWRGRAIEPVLRESLERLAPPVIDRPDGAVGVTGAYWTRNNVTEVDIVAGDRSPVAKQILAVGSIKWRESKPFTRGDLGVLQAQRAKVPGAGPATPLLAVSRSGFDAGCQDVAQFGPADLLDAYRDS